MAVSFKDTCTASVLGRVAAMATGTVPHNITEANLPISVVPNTNPPIFRWRQMVDTLVGRQWVEHEEALPPTVERALVTLIGITKQLLYDNAALQGRIDALSKKTEAAATTQPATPTPKKGKQP